MTVVEDKAIIDSLKVNWTPVDYYNFSDLNRVESATIAVKNQIARYRGIIVNLVNVNTTRTQSTIEFADSLNRIESNIESLKQTFPAPEIYQFSKTNWTYNQPFSFLDANRYEQNLYNMYYNIESNISLIQYCGQFYAGQGVL